MQLSSGVGLLVLGWFESLKLVTDRSPVDGAPYQLDFMDKKVCRLGDGPALAA